MIHFQQEHLDAYAFQTAKEGKNFCGDSYYITANDDYFLCVLADGLGSGEFAYEASSAVAEVVRSNPDKDVNTLMNYCNDVLAQKRGAAVGILKVDFRKKEFEYSCVGNIRFYLYTPSGKLTYPLPVTGYLSGRPQTFRTQIYPYEEDSRFLIHSDGFINVNTKKLLGNFESIAMIADMMKEQQTNKADDMTFIVGSLH